MRLRLRVSLPGTVQLDAARIFPGSLQQLFRAEPITKFTDTAPLRLDKLAAVRHALEQTNCLRPLAKPALVKALCSVCEPKSGKELPAACIDTLRAMCFAIDAPLPPMVPVVQFADSPPEFA